jgi:hypothetical protein
MKTKRIEFDSNRYENKEYISLVDELTNRPCVIYSKFPYTYYFMFVIDSDYLDGERFPWEITMIVEDKDE